jgi:hypothetical protein
MSARPATYDIDDRTVTMPCVVRDASAGTAMFDVDAAAARALVPEAFDLVETAPGRCQAVLAVIDYRDNDLGDYNEVSIALVVRERGKRGGLLDVARGRFATFIHWLPVDQGFTRDAGEQIWGFPKTVERIDFHYEDDRAVCRLVSGAKPVLTLSLPRGGKRSLPDREMATYTYIHGVPHRVRFTSGAEGFGVRLGGAELSLGDHPYADRLRSLGLPRRALMSTWMEHMRGRFEAPEKL